MKTFLLDINRCNGCYSCQIVCKDEHCDASWLPYAAPQPETGQFWMKVTEKVRGQVPVVKVTYTPTLCAHCAKAPCAGICPADAFDIREDGLMVLLPEKCTGCMACVDACPIGAIYANTEASIAQKCTGCAHLLDNGWTVPRCVDACPTEALLYLEDSDIPDEAVSLPALEGLGSRVRYLNLPKRFVAGITVDLAADEVVIGARVDLLDPIGNSIIATSKTDDFGDFFFNQVEASRYTLRIAATGYTGVELTVDATDEDINIGPIDMKAI